MGQNQQNQAPWATPSSLADAELVRSCRAGDMTAWRSLYDRYAPLVHRFASALGVPTDEREDAAQDIFIGIYRIAARHAIRLGRRRRTRETMRLTMLKEKPTVLVDPSERSTQIATLDRMLAKLPPKKRTVLVLFEIEGLSAKEI